MDEQIPQEVFLIGSLHQNAGFQHLLKKLDLMKDELLESLVGASNDEEERRITANWRAYKQCTDIMREIVSTSAQQTDEFWNENLLNTQGLVMDPAVTNYGNVEVGESS